MRVRPESPERGRRRGDTDYYSRQPYSTNHLHIRNNIQEGKPHSAIVRFVLVASWGPQQPPRRHNATPTPTATAIVAATFAATAAEAEAGVGQGAGRGEGVDEVDHSVEAGCEE